MKSLNRARIWRTFNLSILIVYLLYARLEKCERQKKRNKRERKEIKKKERWTIEIKVSKDRRRKYISTVLFLFFFVDTTNVEVGWKYLILTKRSFLIKYHVSLSFFLSFILPLYLHPSLSLSSLFFFNLFRSFRSSFLLFFLFSITFSIELINQKKGSLYITRGLDEC